MNNRPHPFALVPALAVAVVVMLTATACAVRFNAAGGGAALADPTPVPPPTPAPPVIISVPTRDAGAESAARDNGLLIGAALMFAALVGAGALLYGRPRPTSTAPARSVPSPMRWDAVPVWTPPARLPMAPTWQPRVTVLPPAGGTGTGTALPGPVPPVLPARSGSPVSPYPSPWLRPARQFYSVGPDGLVTPVPADAGYALEQIATVLDQTLQAHGVGLRCSGGSADGGRAEFLFPLFGNSPAPLYGLGDVLFAQLGLPVQIAHNAEFAGVTVYGGRNE